MKNIYLFYILTALILGACAEDKGNYDYDPINDLTISGINTKTYTLVLGDTLKIPVTLKRSKENSTENLNYLWEFDGKEVANTQSLCIPSPAGISYGEKKCRYTVTDPATGMKWYQTFTVNIVSPFNWGYYLLTEKEDHSTVISFLPISDSTEIKSCIHTTNIDGLPLGKYPATINGSYGSNQQLGTYTWTIKVITQEGEYPVIVTNTTTFTSLGVVTNENFIDASAGYTFKPSNVITDPRNNTYFISEGKIIGYTEGLLYRPAKHPKEYHWNYPIAYSGVTQCGLFFDEISRKYYFVTSQEDDPEAGIVGDSYALDKVIDFEDNRNFKDEAIIGYSTSSMYAPDYSSASNIVTVVSAENGKIHLTEFTYFTDYTDYSESRKCTSHEELAMVDANIHTKAVLANKTWYFSSDNKIYSTPEILPKIEPFIDIPTQYGKVVNLSTSVMGSRLIVTTYDENSPEEMKGSILIIDIQSKEIIPHPHTIHKCVHIFRANSDGFGWGEGDGK